MGKILDFLRAHEITASDPTGIEPIRVRDVPTDEDLETDGYSRTGMAVDNDGCTLSLWRRKRDNLIVFECKSKVRHVLVMVDE